LEESRKKTQLSVVGVEFVFRVSKRGEQKLFFEKAKTVISSLRMRRGLIIERTTEWDGSERKNICLVFVFTYSWAEL